MTLWRAQPCGCEQRVSVGQKRDKLCEHGHVFVSERAKGSSAQGALGREPNRAPAWVELAPVGPTEKTKLRVVV